MPKGSNMLIDFLNFEIIVEGFQYYMGGKTS